MYSNPSQATILERIQAALPNYQVSGNAGMDGEERYYALAKALEEAAENAAHKINNYLILSADYPASATATLSVQTTVNITEDIWLLAGQRVARTPWGTVFVLAEDWNLPIGTLALATVPMNVVAYWSTYDGNTPTNLIELDIDGGVSPESTLKFREGTSPAAKTFFVSLLNNEQLSVLSSGEAAGGVDGQLLLWADTRKIPPKEGETEAAFRKRLRAIPDVVTPNAIVRRVDELLKPYNITCTLIEWFDYGWVIGDSLRGSLQHSPPVKRWHFLVLIPDLGIAQPGWCVYHGNQGCLNRNPIGNIHLDNDFVYEGAQDLVNDIKLGGVSAKVRREV